MTDTEHRIISDDHTEWMESETTQDALETFQHIFREFIGLCTVNSNHLNLREMALAKTKIEEAGMWFERALEKHHRIPVANNSIVVPVTDSTTEKDKI